MPHSVAGENITIDFNGDEDHPLIRMFGEEARQQVRLLTNDDIPF